MRTSTTSLTTTPITDDLPQYNPPLTHENGAQLASKRIMRLADFILTNRAAILAEWEAFAFTCVPAAGSMGLVAPRGPASESRTGIAADLKTPQGDYE